MPRTDVLLRLSLLMIVPLLACSCDDGKTAVYLQLRSNMPIPAELDALDVRILGPDGKVEGRLVYALTLGKESLPVEFEVKPVNGDPDREREVRVAGIVRGTGIMERSVRFTFVKGRIKSLILDLDAACRGVVCGAGNTCVASGVCEADRVDVRKLMDAVPSGVALDAATIDASAALDAGATDAPLVSLGGAEVGMAPDLPPQTDTAPDASPLIDVQPEAQLPEPGAEWPDVIALPEPRIDVGADPPVGAEPPSPPPPDAADAGPTSDGPNRAMLRLIAQPPAGWVRMQDAYVFTQTLLVGDTVTPGTEMTVRMFLTFDLTALPSDARITSATLNIRQSTCNTAWDKLGALLVEHVDVGMLLDVGDFDVAPLPIGGMSEAARITPTGAGAVWKTAPVLPFIQDDFDHRSERGNRAQLRMRFEVPLSGDGKTDLCAFYPPLSAGNEPFIELGYEYP